MGEEDIKFETRFSRSRGVFPYVAGILGLAVLVVIGMVVTGIGVRFLPFGEYLVPRAPTAADGSEALSLVELQQKEDGKTLAIDGAVLNRTDAAIKNLVAVIAVTDKYTLPSQTVNVPLVPAELGPNMKGEFHIIIPLDEKGLGGYSVRFRLSRDGLFVAHKEEYSFIPTIEQKTTP